MKYKLILFLSVLFHIVSCSLFDSKNKEFVKKVEANIIGTYKLDTVNSILDGYENVPKDWEVIFTKDRKFYFSKILPFIFDSSGTWEYIFENDVAYLQLTYKKSTSHQQVLTDSNTLIMLTPRPSDDNIAVTKLVLNKIK